MSAIETKLDGTRVFYYKSEHKTLCVSRGKSRASSTAHALNSSARAAHINLRVWFYAQGDDVMVGCYLDGALVELRLSAESLILYV